MAEPLPPVRRDPDAHVHPDAGALEDPVERLGRAGLGTGARRDHRRGAPAGARGRISEDGLDRRALLPPRGTGRDARRARLRPGHPTPVRAGGDRDGARVEAPPPPPAGVEARPVRDLDEYLQAWRIAMETFNEPEEDAAGWLAAAPALWEQQDHVERFAHLAFVDGRPVGFAFASPGRPACCWAAAASWPRRAAAGPTGRWSRPAGRRRSASASRRSVIQAGAMSRPILERSRIRVDLLGGRAGGSGARGALRHLT